MIFPSNPSHGMIVEVSTGLFFQFDITTQCWIRVDGIEALGLATPSKDGLMDPLDLKKLNKLIIPPPQATLKGEDCPVTFSDGKIRLISSDESMSVGTSLKVINKIGAVSLDEPWALHENTVGVNFNLNIDSLVTELKKSGKFTQVLIQGKQGPRGPKGDDGIDQLDTGPQGDQGIDGKNSPYNGAFSSEINAFDVLDQSTNRAIVDIKTEQSEDGNFLVVTRANIGNPNACPREVRPKDIMSPLGLIINQTDNALLHKLETPNECGNPCTICTTSLHYINLDTLSESIFNRFKERIEQLKKDKEDLVTYWLRSMVTMFNEQKHAICCALENCRSARRNNQTRQYLESQRIQAAISDLSLTIDGLNDRVVVDTDADKACATTSAVNTRRGVGCDCALQYTLDAKLHTTDPRGKFTSRSAGDVSNVQDTVLGSGRVGLLNVHEIIEMPTSERGPATAGEGQSGVLLDSGIIPPPQTPSITDWVFTIDNFSIPNIEPTVSGTVTLIADVFQNNIGIARFNTTISLTERPTSTLTLNPNPFSLGQNFGSSANLSSPISLALSLIANVTVDQPTSFVSIDYTIGTLKLVGSSLEIALKSDWNTNSWSVEGGSSNVQSLTVPSGSAASTGTGFIELDLPAGRYVAEITDCCVNTSTTRSLWSGVAAIEYNDTTTQTVVFPDLGSFNNVSDARQTYLGSSISFEHTGGHIRSWIIDPDGIASNNAGSLTICILPAKCVEGFDGSVVTETDAIFMYKNEISPLNLIGILQPFVGDIDAATNYGYGNVTDGAASISFGPSHEFKRTKSFFYLGSDGLSFFTIHGGTGESKQNTISMSFNIDNNTTTTNLKVGDEQSEVSKVGGGTGTKQPDLYEGKWTVGTFGSDGLAVGTLDLPNNAAWTISVIPNDLGINTVWQANGADGNIVGLFTNDDGISTTKASEKIIFTPIRVGCLMTYKQITWLERGHRIGAACSGVVELNGQKYIIVKRSIADDMTCGGGESLANPCVATFIAMGFDHPAIAWPTINGEEFLGIPTSGSHGFTFDETLSNKVLELIKNGNIENVNGDPATNIPAVLFPLNQ